MLLTEILNLASVHTQKCPLLPGCNYAASTLIIFLGCHRRSESPKLFFFWYHFFVPKASRNAMKHMTLSFEMKVDDIWDHFLMLGFQKYSLDTVGFRTFRGGPGFLNKIVDFGGPIFM